MRFILIAASLLFFADLTVASGDYLDYFARDVGKLDKRSQRQFDRVLAAMDQGDYPRADEVMAELLPSLDPERVADATRGRLLSNAGILKAISAKEREGLLLLTEGAELLESVYGPFDLALFNTLLVQGTISADIEDYEVAEEALRRAQHIAHRHEGVYTSRQLPVIDMLTNLNLSQELLGAADREQRFLLKISEQTYGDNSEEMLPVLQTVGSYFAHRGEMVPRMNPLVDERLPSSERRIATMQYRVGLFRESVKLYKRAIKIIEDTYGPNDPRLVQPLQGLAEARLLQGTANSEAEDAMERALELVANNPATDVADHARALVRLGDVYTRTSDGRADDVYLEAWNLLADQPELMDMRDQLFGAPTRIYPEVRTYWVSRRPMAADEDEHLYADVEYTVNRDGRVGDVAIIDANIPNDEKNMTKARLKAARFRPRIVEGEVVETPGLFLHQTFEVMEPPEPVAKISVSTGPADQRTR